MSVEVEKGSRVRVSFEGKFHHNSINGNPVIHTEKPGEFDKQWTLPAEAKVEVLEKPIPPEPPAGSVIQFPDGSVFAHAPMKWTDDYWIRLTGDEFDWFRWVEVVKAHGTEFTQWTKPGVDLSDAKPFAKGMDENVYAKCSSSHIKVYRALSTNHLDLQFLSEGRVCLNLDEAVSFAKRILKTYQKVS